MTNAEKVIGFIKKHPDDMAQVKEKLFELAVGGSAADLRNFFVRCDKLDLFGNAVAYTTFITLMENDREDVVHSLFETANERSPMYGILQIGSALASFKNFDVKRGALNLRNGLFRALSAGDSDLPDRDLLMKNSFLLETLSWPEPNTFAKPEFEIIHSNKRGDSPYSFFAVCDPVYFRRFADGFVGGIRGACGSANIFLLLVNPDDDVLDGAAGYDGVTAAKTSYQGDRLYEFCSAARFAVAGDVLKITGAPTIFMDIDVTPPPECGAILAEMTEHSVSVRDTGDLFPSERISSSLAASRPCEEAFAFWDAAGGFVLANMNREGPISSLGKTALYEAVCRGHAAGWDIFTQNRGIDIPDAGSALKTDRFYWPASVSVEGKIVLDRRSGIPDKKHERGGALTRGTFNDLDKLMNYIRQNGNNSDKCVSALINFTKSTDVTRLHSFFSRCHKIGLNTPEITFSTLYHFALQSENDILASLLDTAQKTDPLYGLFHIGMSFADCVNFEVESCGYHLREGAYHCLRNNVNFPDLHFIMQNAYLMESVAWPSPERYPMIPEGEIIYDDRFENSPPYLLSVSSSPPYVRKYWDARIKNNREICGDVNIWLSLVNPDDDIIAKAKSHRGIVITAGYLPDMKSEFFGLLVVLTLRKYLEIFRQPIVGFELDSIYPPEIKDVFSFMTQCPISIAENDDDLFPALRLDGGCAGLMPCDEAFAFSDMFIDHLREDLARKGPIYLFDQMSLYRVVAEGRKKGWKMIDINKHTDGGFRRLFKQTDKSLSLAERQKMRLSNEYIFAGMSEDRRFILQKLPQKQEECE
ncbi:MAG: hypothetical protein LBB28_03375 [Synergistaceae bacterium]|jgi:hypothetical protein|nr:hypothetical protein [Synergistaceae bacterium]